MRVKTFIGDQLNNGKMLPELFIVFMQQFQALKHDSLVSQATVL